MAKKKPTAEPADRPGPNGGKPETVSGYFRQVFQENPRLLRERSNQPLLDRWLADHPGETEVPKAVKQNLANIKSVLRSKKRTRVAVRAEDRQAAGQRSQVGRVPT